MRRLILLFLTALLAATAVPAAADAARRGQCLLRTSGPQCYLWTGKVTFIADGDTVYVDVDGDGSRTRFPVRITGMNAMEQTTYTSRASQRRGECHAVEATARLEQLLRASKYKVRLLAQDPASRSQKRLRRSVAVKVKGRWIDVGRTMLTEGHAIWLPNHRESAWNRDYSILQLRAQRAQLNLWDPDYCGAGPAANLTVSVKYDAVGKDASNLNGEYLRVVNHGSTAVSLAGWHVRDGGPYNYNFPSWAKVGAGKTIYVHVGRGTSSGVNFYWGRTKPVFDNPTRSPRYNGDGGYLFDPKGNLRASSMWPTR